MLYFIVVLMIFSGLAIVLIYLRRTQFHEWLEDGNEVILKRALRLNPVDTSALPALIRKHIDRSKATAEIQGHAIKIHEVGMMRFGPKYEAYSFICESEISLVKPSYSKLYSIDTGFMNTLLCERLLTDEAEREVRLMGAFPKEALTGPQLMASYEAFYYASLPLYPEAFLHLQFGEWGEGFDNSVTFKADSPLGKIDLEFEFGQTGTISAVNSKSLCRIESGALQPTDWRVEYDEYQDYGGLMRPKKSRYFWMTPSGGEKYISSTLYSVESLSQETQVPKESFDGTTS